MARHPPTVVDASVAAKWFLEEADSGAAHRLLEAHLSGDPVLVAPALLPYEVANALRYHPRIGAELLARAMESLMGLGLGLAPPSDEGLREAVRIAFRLGITVYDAAYVALADHLDGVLVTADERQRETAGDRAVHVREWAAR